MRKRKNTPPTPLLPDWSDFGHRLRGVVCTFTVGSPFSSLRLLCLFTFCAGVARGRWCLYRELDSANTEEKLKELIQSDKQKGKITQTLAKLDLSRIYTYDRGINQLGTTMTSELTRQLLNLKPAENITWTPSTG